MKGRFHKRLAQQRSAIGTSAAPTPNNVLEAIGHVAQIALAVVAIFGYFYTVRPIYQKERLEEQVAAYEGIISEQKPKVQNLENQLSGLVNDRDRLKTELATLHEELLSAQSEKDRIEEQVQFMTYKYHLPDGKPATTYDEVLRAQDAQISRSFLSNARWSCGLLGEKDAVFQRQYYSKDKNFGETKSFPFTQEELAVWKRQGAKYPLARARSCVTDYVNDVESQFADDPRSSKLIAALKTGMFRKLDTSEGRDWNPPFEPEQAIEEFASSRAAIEAEMEKEYQEVERAYGNWKDVWGEASRAIAKHNYEVGRLNARNKAQSAKVGLEWKYQEKANVFRKQLNDEVTRIIEHASTPPKE